MFILNFLKASRNKKPLEINEKYDQLIWALVAIIIATSMLVLENKYIALIGE